MRWLLQEGPDGKKHKERAHPILTFLIHYTLVVSTTFYAHDILVQIVSQELDEACTVSPELIRRRQLVGPFLGLYFLMYFVVRLVLQWKSKPYLFNAVFYEQTFMCSVTVACSALSFYFNRPLVSQAFCITVGIDQLLWYVPVWRFLSIATVVFCRCSLFFLLPMNRYVDIIGYLLL